MYPSIIPFYKSNIASVTNEYMLNLSNNNLLKIQWLNYFVSATIETLCINSSPSPKCNLL